MIPVITKEELKRERKSKSLGKGTKLGREGGDPAKLDKSIRQMIKERVDWDKALTIIEREAFGGQTYLNGNGKEMIASPKYDWMKLLLEYGFGKPDQFITTAQAHTEAMNDFTDFAKSYALPKSDTFVNSNGELNETKTEAILA